MWVQALGGILGVICGTVGLLAVGGIGWLVFEFAGVSRENYRALKLGMLVFGLPAALAGLVIGYRLGVTLIPPGAVGFGMLGA